MINYDNTINCLPYSTVGGVDSLLHKIVPTPSTYVAWRNIKTSQRCMDSSGLHQGSSLQFKRLCGKTYTWLSTVHWKKKNPLQYNYYAGEAVLETHCTLSQLARLHPFKKLATWNPTATTIGRTEPQVTMSTSILFRRNS